MSFAYCQNQLLQKQNKKEPTIELKQSIVGEHIQNQLNSKYFCQYLDYFQIKKQEQSQFHSHQREEIKQLHTKLRQNGFQVCSQFVKDIKIISMYKSRSSEVVQIQFQLSYYKTKVLVLNQTQESLTHQKLAVSGNGSFGDVYFALAFKQTFAIKCLKFDFTKQSFQQILKQYFFLLLFSALQIGPKTNKIYGFDLLVSEKCIQFSTQICIDSIQIQEKDMKHLLLKLHMLKIVHRDIKPSNIMYSPSLKKNIFIDFGACDFLLQPIGINRLSYFIGTLGYCSQEMASLVSKQQKYIDLYFNDTYGLSASINKILSRGKFSQLWQFCYDQQQNYSRTQSLQSIQLLTILLKYYLWQQSYQQFTSFLKKRINYFDSFETFQKNVLLFFFQVIPNTQKRILFQKMFSNDLLQNDSILLQLSKSYGKRHSYIYLANYKNQKFLQMQKFYKILEIQFNKQGEQSYEPSLQAQLIIINQSSASLLKLLTSPISPKMTLQIYMIVLVECISFESNALQLSIDQKLQICNFFIKQTERILTHQLVNDCLMMQSLKPIAITLRTLLAVFCNFIACPYAQIQFYWKLVKNYSFLCRRIQKSTLRKTIIQNLNFRQIPQLSISKKILLFWKSYAQFRTSFFIERNKDSDILEHDDSKQSVYLSTQIFYIQSQKIQQMSIEQQKLYTIHKEFLQVLVLGNIPFDQIVYDRIQQKLYDQPCYKSLSSQDYGEFRKYIIFVCSLLCQHNGLQNSYKIYNLIQNLLKERVLKPNYQNKIPFFTKQLLVCYANFQEYKKIKQILDVFDYAVNCQQISDNFHYQFRLLVGFHLNSHKTVDKIAQIVSRINTQDCYDCYNLFRVQIVFYGIEFYVQKKQKQKRTIQSFYSVLMVIFQKGAELVHKLKFKQSNNQLLQIATVFQKVQAYSEIIRFCYKFSQFYKNYQFFKDKLQKISHTLNISVVFQLVNYICLNFLHISKIQQLYLYIFNKFHKNNIKICLDEVKRLDRLNQIQQKMKLHRLTRYQIYVRYSSLFFKLRSGNWEQKQSFYNFLLFYQNLKNYVSIALFFKLDAFFPILWRAHQYCDSPIEKRMQLVKQMIKFIYSANFETFTLFYHKRMKNILICNKKSLKCSSSQTCVHRELINSFYQDLTKNQNEKNHEYYCIIGFYCLCNNNILCTRVRQKFLCFIKRNIQDLHYCLRVIILQKLYLFLYQKQQKKSKWMCKKLLKYSCQKLQKEQKLIVLMKKGKMFHKYQTKMPIKVIYKKLKIYCSH